jgi:hypothetical protein
MHTKVYASSLVLRRWRMSGHTKDELYNKQESNYENLPIGPPHPDSHERRSSHGVWLF